MHTEQLQPAAAAGPGAGGSEKGGGQASERFITHLERYSAIAPVVARAQAAMMFCLFWPS